MCISESFLQSSFEIWYCPFCIINGDTEAQCMFFKRVLKHFVFLLNSLFNSDSLQVTWLLWLITWLKGSFWMSRSQHYKIMFFGGWKRKSLCYWLMIFLFSLFFFFFLSSSSEWLLRFSITTISLVYLVREAVEVPGFSRTRAPQFLSSRCRWWCLVWPTIPRAREHNTTHTYHACWTRRHGNHMHIPTNTSSINSITPRTFTSTLTSEDPPPHLCKVCRDHQPDFYILWWMKAVWVSAVRCLLHYKVPRRLLKVSWIKIVLVFTHSKKLYTNKM